MKFEKLGYVVPLVLFMSCSNMKSNSLIEQLQNGHYSIKYDNISLEIDPDLGARIISVKINSKELLLQERDELVNWGSTFWLAPQSLWNWPPPHAIHLGRYEAEINEYRLLFTSDIDAQFGVRSSKEFSFDEEKKCLEIQYKIINESDSALQYGPWEITVVPAKKAKVFFPIGKEPVGTKSTIQFENRDGIAWFDYTPETLSNRQKTFNNTPAGWLAYLNGDRTLFVKTFDDVSPEEIAQGQGNIEVYVSKEFEYIELENHGKYTLLQPGESMKYKVNWYISSLPNSITSDEYSEALIDHVRTIVEEN